MPVREKQREWYRCHLSIGAIALQFIIFANYLHCSLYHRRPVTTTTEKKNHKIFDLIFVVVKVSGIFLLRIENN